MAPPCMAPPQQIAPTMEAFMPPPPPFQAPQLRISEVLPESALGTPEMPTIGSAGHRSGTCKPCAFLHTKGCGSGVECKFCHLCTPGEKKRRQKFKHAVAKISANFVASGVEPQVAMATEVGQVGQEVQVCQEVQGQEEEVILLTTVPGE